MSADKHLEALKHDLGERIYQKFPAFPNQGTKCVFLNFKIVVQRSLENFFICQSGDATLNSPHRLSINYA
jgi:hypothetical protein